MVVSCCRLCNDCYADEEQLFPGWKELRLCYSDSLAITFADLLLQTLLANSLTKYPATKSIIPKTTLSISTKAIATYFR